MIGPEITMASFSHLDEKKILRKVNYPNGECQASIPQGANSVCPQMDIRLIPMLALLYLLSFLDRKCPTFPHHDNSYNRSCAECKYQVVTLAMRRLRAYRKTWGLQMTSTIGA
jgi:hypothetical protein